MSWFAWSPHYNRPVAKLRWRPFTVCAPRSLSPARQFLVMAEKLFTNYTRTSTTQTNIKMAAIGSLVFCTGCGNLLDSANGDENVTLTCDVCGARCKGMVFFILSSSFYTRARNLWKAMAQVDVPCPLDHTFHSQETGYVTPAATVQHSRDFLHAQILNQRAPSPAIQSVL